MTPKDIAQELVDEFITEGCLFANAKKCALICVKQMLKENISVNIMLSTHGTARNIMVVNDRIKFLQDVKTELIALNEK